MRIQFRKLTNEDLRQELLVLEERFGMSSSTFYHQYRLGEMGDSDEVLHWANLCYSAQRLGILQDLPSRV